jgi:hypothetical protein
MDGGTGSTVSLVIFLFPVFFDLEIPPSTKEEKKW